jgi:hypothetical protein
MTRKKYSPEQIIRLLREAEVFIAEGMTVVDGQLPFFVPLCALVNGYF